MPVTCKICGVHIPYAEGRRALLEVSRHIHTQHPREFGESIRMGRLKKKAEKLQNLNGIIDFQPGLLAIVKGLSAVFEKEKEHLAEIDRAREIAALRSEKEKMEHVRDMLATPGESLADLALRIKKQACELNESIIILADIIRRHSHG